MTRAHAICLITLIALLSARADAADDAPVIPIPDDLKGVMARLGDGVLGEALPAQPITEPARLRHLTAGTWTYEIVSGKGAGGKKRVSVEPLPSNGKNVEWEVDNDGKDIATLEVTTQHDVVKLAQDMSASDRVIEYKPGLILDPGMKAGTSKVVDSSITSYKGGDSKTVEYTGHLEYTTRYVGSYRVHVPAGIFDARLLEHRYQMTLGPARISHVEYSFYADDVGDVANVSDQNIRAAYVYRSNTSDAAVLISPPSR